MSHGRPSKQSLGSCRDLEQVVEANQLLLSKPTTRTVISSRAFSGAVPTIWTSLPHHILIVDSFGRFRQSLRTHLYLLAIH